MKKRAFFLLSVFFLLCLISFNTLTAQDNELYEQKYRSALKAHVKKLLANFGKNGIDRERFLIQQMRMINAEIKTRITGISGIRKSYFLRLEDRLSEVRELRSRLSSSASPRLNTFIEEIEKKIKQTIDDGSIDYDRQRVIEDAIQLLYIAEELIKIDPNARVVDNPQISEGLDNTKTDFADAFGEELFPDSPDTETAYPNATIYDVYEAWKQNERVKFNVKWADIQIIKNRMLKTGSEADKSRMFRRELLHASEMFNFGYYDLAEKSFSEIINRYAFIGKLDDCHFYKAESNYILGRYNLAQHDFSTLVRKYPTSTFVPGAYRRLMHIAYHFDRYDKVLDHLRSMQAIVSSSTPQMDEVLLLATVSALKAGRFDEVISYANEISPNSQYSRQASFALAEAYAGTGNLAESAKIFQDLLAIEGLNPDFRSVLLLKMGYLAYENGDYLGAISFFDKIPGSFEKYDRVLIGYGWSHYKLELEKPLHQERDFSYAKKYLELLLEVFYGSDYILEARSLLGYIHQLEAKPNKALENFEYTFGAKETKLLSDQLNQELDALQDVYSTTERLEDKSLEEQNLAAFTRANKVKNKLRQPIAELKYMDLSATGVAKSNEVNRLKGQLEELDRLKKLAIDKGSNRLVDRIEKMQLKIYRAVNAIPIRERSGLGINYFDEHPLARKQSVLEHENAKIMRMREELNNQQKLVYQNIAELDAQITQAKATRSYRKLVDLELSRDRFVDLKNQLDQLETQAFSFEIKSSDINLNRWADYGAFGMANVNFAIKNQKKERLEYMQKQIREIDNFLQRRKASVEHKIAQIDDEITLMTRRVREQERRREREELRRQFEETYFDTHDTELEQPNTTSPPKIQDEPDEE